MGTQIMGFQQSISTILFKAKITKKNGQNGREILVFIG